MLRIDPLQQYITTASGSMSLALCFARMRWTTRTPCCLMVPLAGRTQDPKSIFKRHHIMEMGGKYLTLWTRKSYTQHLTC